MEMQNANHVGLSSINGFSNKRVTTSDHMLTDVHTTGYKILSSVNQSQYVYMYRYCQCRPHANGRTQ